MRERAIKCHRVLNEFHRLQIHTSVALHRYIVQLTTLLSRILVQYEGLNEY